MIKENIGRRIKEIRMFELRMSQDELSSKIGWDRTYLSRIESGKQNITIENLYTVCNALGVTLSEFFKPFNSFELEEK